MHRKKKSIEELKNELRYLYRRAQLAPWMIGVTMQEFHDFLPKCDEQDAIADFVYNKPEQWMHNFSFLITGGVEGESQKKTKGTARERKIIGGAILTSGIIHTCQSQIYEPETMGRHVGFSKFISSVKSWSDAGEIITLLSDCKFLFVSEVYIAADTNKTLLRTVSESFNDLLERRENANLVTIISIKPTMIERAKLSSDFLGSSLKTLLESAGDVDSIIRTDKRLCRIAF